ncbi:MAG: C-GCAxxG-C-C family protein [Clostridia bacterium]|nr:C-GCAxxG-C-C family protein [Clostridia bacterium]
MSRHGDIAYELFTERHFNCAQSVFCAFRDITGLSERDAIRLSASFGGGMGRLREVCGGFSAIIAVLGWVCAPDDPADNDLKAAHYLRVQQLAERFKARNGALICRDLLGDLAGSGYRPEERTETYYATRPCPRIVRIAAEILDEYLEENGLSRAQL